MGQGGSSWPAVTLILLPTPLYCLQGQWAGCAGWAAEAQWDRDHLQLAPSARPLVDAGAVPGAGPCRRARSTSTGDPWLMATVLGSGPCLSPCEQLPSCGGRHFPWPQAQGRATWATGAHDPRPSHPPTPPGSRWQAVPGSRSSGTLLAWAGLRTCPDALDTSASFSQPPEPVCGFPPGAGPGDPPMSPASSGHWKGATATLKAKAPWCAWVQPPPAPRCHCWPVTSRPSGHANSSERRPDVAFHDKPTTPA